MWRPDPRLFVLFLTGLLLFAVVVAAGMGAINFTAMEVLNVVAYKLGLPFGSQPHAAEMGILWSIRFPRIIAAGLVGMSLAAAGAGIQGLFRNPLADPGLLGISSGASFSAAAYIVLFSGLGIAGYAGLSIVTFAGAALTAFVVYRLSHANHGVSVATMLLAGVAVNAIAGAGTGLLTYLSDESQLRDITFWLLGSMAGAGWNNVIILAVCTLVPALFILRLARPLNVLALGESEAACLGVRVSSLKLQIVFLTTLMVGASVAIAGVVGFIGLVIPHMVRMITGPDHSIVLKASMILGAVVVIAADTVSRLIIAPAELPLGIITAVIGAPVFLSILMREKRHQSILAT